MDLNTYLKQEGFSQKYFAALINRNSSEVCYWMKRKLPMPVKVAVRIEQVTNGKVSRQDLFPNDWKEIWPELEDKPCSKES